MAHTTRLNATRPESRNRPFHMIIIRSQRNAAFGPGLPAPAVIAGLHLLTHAAEARWCKRSVSQVPECPKSENTGDPLPFEDGGGP